MTAAPSSQADEELRQVAGLQHRDQVFFLITPARPYAAGPTLRVLRGENWHLLAATPHQHRWEVLPNSDMVTTLQDVLNGGFRPLDVIPLKADLDAVRLTLGLSWDPAAIEERVASERSTP